MLKVKEVATFGQHLSLEGMPLFTSAPTLFQEIIFMTLNLQMLLDFQVVELHL
jgi:hypothetical protein